MENWKLEADVSQAFGSKEWISAEIKTAEKSYNFSTSDKTLFHDNEHILINVEVVSSGILITSKSDTGRKLSVAPSPSLLSQIIIAYGDLAAKAGDEFPFAEAARALTQAQTSIVNRPRVNATS